MPYRTCRAFPAETGAYLTSKINLYNISGAYLTSKIYNVKLTNTI